MLRVIQVIRSKHAIQNLNKETSRVTIKTWKKHDWPQANKMQRNNKAFQISSYFFHVLKSILKFLIICNRRETFQLIYLFYNAKTENKKGDTRFCLALQKVLIENLNLVETFWIQTKFPFICQGFIFQWDKNLASVYYNRMNYWLIVFSSTTFKTLVRIKHCTTHYQVKCTRN